VRKGLAMLVGNFKGVEVVFEAENGVKLLEMITLRPVDIVLLDFQMPQMDGVECCTILRAECPEIKVLFISHLSTSESIQHVISSGAHGFFSKNSKLIELETAIHNVKQKDFYFSNDLGIIIREALSSKTINIPNLKVNRQLSQREIEIVKLAAQEYSNVEIGEILNINIRTVETHRSRIMEKTSSKNFIGVVLYALKS